jgi:type II secretory pathway pseudopilin PulG
MQQQQLQQLQHLQQQQQQQQQQQHQQQQPPALSSNGTAGPGTSAATQEDAISVLVNLPGMAEAVGPCVVAFGGSYFPFVIIAR